MNEVSNTSAREESGVTGAQAERWPPWPSAAARNRLWVAFAGLWMIALLVPKPFELHAPPEWFELLSFSKGLHLAGYCFFTLLTAWLLTARRNRLLLLAAVAAHALLSEFLQYCLRDFSHRTGRWPDVGLDGIGIVLGLVLGWKWWRQ